MGNAKKKGGKGAASGGSGDRLAVSPRPRQVPMGGQASEIPARRTPLASDAATTVIRTKPAKTAPLRAHVVAGFPDLVRPYFSGSMMGKARERGKLDVTFHDLYEACETVGGRIDDRPFGGGAGMVLRPEPIAHAMEAILLAEGGAKKILPIYLGPRGKRLTQPRVEKLAKSAQKKALVLLCGHYEGVDERVLEHYGFSVYSVGDYVLSSGELAAAVLLDAVARLAPGALANDESARQESFSSALGRRREYPHYTRPAVWEGLAVPPELLSGHHAKIDAWRRGKLT